MWVIFTLLIDGDITIYELKKLPILINFILLMRITNVGG